MGSSLRWGDLSSYRTAIAGNRPLDRERERELVRLFQGGDRRAGNDLVVACLPMVLSISLEYRRWNASMEDIVQQGLIGLLRGMSKFDLDKECRLMTYAAYWVRAEIREYVVRTYRLVRLGTTKAERRALRAYRTTRETNAVELSKVSGLTPERAEQLLPSLAMAETSLDAAHAADERAPIERMDSGAPTPEDEASKAEHRRLAQLGVVHALIALSDRERTIATTRLMTEDKTTLESLGEQLGVSKERVRQIEQRLVSKLRESLGDLQDVAAALGA